MKRSLKLACLALILVPFLNSCEKDLQYKNSQELNNDNFFKTADDASAAVTAMYSGMMQGYLGNGWGPEQAGYTTQASQTTDEAVCNWDDSGRWKKLNGLVFDPDFNSITGHYSSLMRYVSKITTTIPKIQQIAMTDELKKRYVGELKALRAYYMQILYLYYGPVPVILDPSIVNTPASAQTARPSKDVMVANIEKDFREAISVLPNKFAGTDYGRFSKAACLTSLMKLYMQEKRWQDAIDAGNQIKTIGFSLTPNYEDNFSIKNKNGNSEIILAVVCNATSATNGNEYRPHYLPTDYYEASNGGFDDAWDGYRMPWKTYDKFSQSDYRLKLLMQKYPTLVGGNIVLRDARAGGDIGAVMLKYGPDPAKTDVDVSAVDIVVMRYADVELLLAEAINELNGPTNDAFNLINDVHTIHGKLLPLAGLGKDAFRTAVQNERLFELWAEGVRRDDLIRWGQFIQRAKDDGFGNVDDHLILYPLPRAAITESAGIVKQNPGYN
ncbi:RagB/SusD family nutrient uptake outer membrane protein [Pedobacter sp. ISL-68]|uniref:RagB/SusD family nutrient uptake outer membrane protein n=1 Tax=unclassified Pedobacter TaxID=2628915 RepID=UPI001BEB7BC5|nr:MULTISPECIES: RagB/SusD family nutrient uptake outer membrane protein [unclassified Pedobacter]MBT2563124.1 RagB/SusD family nutrient uptake outer membrane protein [Pedobacter sp. ISL-64]MBT2593462.1 RagB/SusD family nutrient uptake outer membrane protein [Pedobacter sp. ISL-68]